MWKIQEQPSRSVLRKRCSENMQQIYKRTPMLKCDFKKTVSQLYWNRTSPWLFYFKFESCKTLPKNTSGGLFWRYRDDWWSNQNLFNYYPHAKTFNQSSRFMKWFVRYIWFYSPMIWKVSPIFEHTYRISLSILTHKYLHNEMLPGTTTFKS